MNDQRYSQRWDLKRKVHRVKLKIGIFSAMLIAGFFIGLYLGLVKTNQGWDSNGMHSNYLLHPQALDIQGDGSKELMACTGREKFIYNDANQAKGTNDLGRVIIFDPANGEIIWNYTHPERNFVVNLIGVPSLKAGVPSIGEYILVQFAHVAASETERNDGNRIRVTRNETGYYETLLLDTLNPVSPVILNLTNEIQGRIVDFIPLKQAGDDDAFPDFVISFYNVTREEEIYNDYGDPLISVSAYHGNGSLAWGTNNTQADAIINSSTIFRPLDLDGTRINNTHHAIKTPDNKVVIFHLETGAVSNRLSIAPGHELEFLVDFFTDVSGDGVIDICACICDTFLDVTTVAFIDGVNGSILDDAGEFQLEEGVFAPLRYKDYEELPPETFFLSTRRNSSTVNLHGVSASGTIQERKSIQIPGFKIDSSELIASDVSVVEPSGIAMVCITNPERGYSHVISLNDMEVLCTLRDAKIAVMGNLLEDEKGVEIASIVDYTDGYRYIIAGSYDFLFLLGPFTMLLFISALAMILISTSILLILRKKIMLLAPQVEKIGEFSKTDGSTHDHVVSRNVKKLKRICITIFIVLLVSSIIFVFFSISGVDSKTSIVNSLDVKAIRSAYATISFIFASLPLINNLYNHAAPKSAMIYIKIQRFFYRKLLRGKKDHEILVLDMDYGRRQSLAIIFSRSLFPILISLTIGLSMFQAFSGVPLRNTVGEVNLTWISDFETYAGLVFVATYILLLYIIPGGWLLDDAGVVYFDEPVDVNAPGDISKISQWLLGWLKGLFGFTALINYVSIFVRLNIFTAFDDDSIFFMLLMSIAIFGIIIIGAPLLYGFLAMLLANSSMMQDLEYNKFRLFRLLEKQGIDTTPRRLRAVLES